MASTVQRIEDVLLNAGFARKEKDYAFNGQVCENVVRKVDDGVRALGLERAAVAGGWFNEDLGILICITKQDGAHGARIVKWATS